MSRQVVLTLPINQQQQECWVLAQHCIQLQEMQPQATQATHLTLHLSCSSLRTNQLLSPEALTLVDNANGAF